MTHTPAECLAEASRATAAARAAIARLRRHGYDRGDHNIARGALRHARRNLHRVAVLAARAAVAKKRGLR